MILNKNAWMVFIVAMGFFGTPAWSTVSLKAPEAPTINLSKVKLALTVFQGEEIPEQTFVVKNLGRGTLHFAVNDDQQWLSTSLIKGTSQEGEAVTVTVSIVGKNLTAGNYQGRITVTGDKGAVTQSIPVFLSVKPKVAKN